jgi:magnesium transporter
MSSPDDDHDGAPAAGDGSGLLGDGVDGHDDLPADDDGDPGDDDRGDLPDEHHADDGNGNGDAIPRVAEGWALADENRLDLSGPMVHFDAQEVADVTQEIRAIAERRGDDSEVVDLPSFSEPPRPATAAGEPEPLDVDELRDAWPFLDLEERSDGLQILPREDAEDYFVALPADDQARLVQHWRPGHRRQWLRLLEPDDAADLIQATDEDARTALLALLDDRSRKEVKALLAYAEDEAGGLMNPRYARLRPQMTADEAISYLRRQARTRVETIYYAYVLDPAQRLLGVCSFRDLFAADPKTTVADVMETDIVRVNDEMDQETVGRVFAEHDLTVVPVVDAQGVMKGIVTVDDIVDVVQEEATEDAQKFGGMEALDFPYLQASWREMLTKRGGWLAILLIGEMLTTTALGYFQTELDHATVLTLFMPLIISSGGNSGSQGSTLVIRAMALGEIRVRDWWRVMRRELLVGLSLGTFLGAVVLLRVAIWGRFGLGDYGDHYILISIAVGFSVVGVVMFGTLSGAMMPFILRAFGLDPASASAPFVATLCDVTGLIIYFTIAKIVLTGILL